MTPGQRIGLAMLLGVGVAGCAATSPRSASLRTEPVPPPPVTRYQSRMSFWLPGCWGHDAACPNVIVAIGIIVPSTPADFTAALAWVGEQLAHGERAGQGNWGVVFDSPGGDPVAAMQLGMQLRGGGWETYTGFRDATGHIPTCFSACPYAFAGGVRRFVGHDGAIGVHRMTVESAVAPGVAVASVQELSTYLGLYLEQMGVSRTVQDAATLTDALVPLSIADCRHVRLDTAPGTPATRQKGRGL
jgi:hypothetical protein